MKNQLNKVLLVAIVLFLAAGLSAQTTKKPAAKTKTTKKSTTKPKAASMPITVKLTSKCEKNLMIFAGPKSQLSNPKQRQVGGLSVNMLYLKTGDVVCIMDAKKKPASCINITKATPQLEINPAGTAIVLP
jgi:hypothetical protein